MASSAGLVVYCAGVTWDDVRGTDFHMATALSQIHPLLWVDPPISIFRAFRSGGLKRALTGVTIEEIGPQMTRVQSVAPPWPNRRLTRLATQWVFRRGIRRAMSVGVGDVIAMIASTPQFRFGALPDAFHIYFATDDFLAGADLMGVPRASLERDESLQLQGADAVVAVSPTLARRWESQGTHVTVIPNGCDPTLGRRVTVAQPAADVMLRAPIVGLVGQLSARLDIDLLEAVAATGVSFLMVGPLDPRFEPIRMRRLTSRENVQWVGRQALEDLPGYYRLMDVGLTPYVDSDFNRASVPLKSLEYVAAGLPVVSTSVSAAGFAPTGAIILADGALDFVSALRRALSMKLDSDFVEARKTFVRDNSWRSRAEALAALSGCPQVKSP